MSRHYGLPPRPGDTAFRRARDAKPAATLFVSAVFGAIAAGVAALSFTAAGAAFSGLFHGASLAAAVVVAAFGCWAYIWIARPRFAAHFRGDGDAFSDLLRFYARAAVVLLGMLALGQFAGPVAGSLAAGLVLCAAGGAAVAAGFQTVLAFVPAYDDASAGSS